MSGHYNSHSSESDLINVSILCERIAPVTKTPTSRSAINRDLSTDLARIASLNVKLIINCLSDEELNFLGSPWPMYVATAHKLGIDVLRIPMPEGLAPLSVEDVDKEMELVIHEYTAKGINILAHCRGGVGRVSAAFQNLEGHA